MVMLLPAIHQQTLIYRLQLGAIQPSVRFFTYTAWAWAYIKGVFI